LEQPLKIPFIAATVLIANFQKSELVSDVLNKSGVCLQKYIDAGAWREVKLLLRFLGCLQCVFEGDGIFPILEELFARAVDLQTASSEDVSDAGIPTVLKDRRFANYAHTVDRSGAGTNCRKFIPQGRKDEYPTNASDIFEDFFVWMRHTACLSVCLNIGIGGLLSRLAALEAPFMLFLL